MSEDRADIAHDILNRASEGKTVEVPYRGDVNCTMLDVLGGIRSACTYTGAGKLKEMPKRTTFIRVSQQLNEVFSGGRSSVLYGATFIRRSYSFPSFYPCTFVTTYVA